MGENSKQITKGKFLYIFIYFYAPGPEKFNVSFSEKNMFYKVTMGKKGKCYANLENVSNHKVE